jgi:Cu(I)/Ag(I) efflux system periplasmic protein CusF
MVANTGRVPITEEISMNGRMTLLALVVGLSTPAWAQQVPDHGAHQASATAAEAAAVLTDGEVRRVDKEAKKITIRHGAIANLDMPPMTMVFQVVDASVLDAVKVGDKVRFGAEKRDGAFTVIHLERAS